MVRTKQDSERRRLGLIRRGLDSDIEENVERNDAVEAVTEVPDVAPVLKRARLFSGDDLLAEEDEEEELASTLPDVDSEREVFGDDVPTPGHEEDELIDGSSVDVVAIANAPAVREEAVEELSVVPRLRKKAVDTSGAAIERIVKAARRRAVQSLTRGPTIQAPHVPIEEALKRMRRHDEAQKCVLDRQIGQVFKMLETNGALKPTSAARNFAAERARVSGGAAVLGVVPPSNIEEQVEGVPVEQLEVLRVWSWGVVDGTAAFTKDNRVKPLGRDDVIVKVSFRQQLGEFWVGLTKVRNVAALEAAVGEWGRLQPRYTSTDRTVYTLRQIVPCIQKWCMACGSFAAPAAVEEQRSSPAAPKLSEEENLERLASMVSEGASEIDGVELFTDNEVKLQRIWEDSRSSLATFESAFAGRKAQHQVDELCVPMMVKMGARALSFFRRIGVEIRESVRLSRLTGKVEMGLFATTYIPQAAFIACFVGRHQWVTQEGPADLSPAAIADARKLGRTLVIRSEEPAREIISKGAYDLYALCTNPWGAMTWREARAVLGGGLANHARLEFANCCFSNASRSDAASHFLPPCLEALRDIEEGEEILVNYGDQYPEFDRISDILMCPFGELAVLCEERGVRLFELREMVQEGDAVLVGRHIGEFHVQWQEEDVKEGKCVIISMPENDGVVFVAMVDAVPTPGFGMFDSRGATRSVSEDGRQDFFLPMGEPIYSLKELDTKF